MSLFKFDRGLLDGHFNRQCTKFVFKLLINMAIIICTPLQAKVSFKNRGSEAVAGCSYLGIETVAGCSYLGIEAVAGCSYLGIEAVVGKYLVNYQLYISC